VIVLILKLLLTPALIGLVSLAGKRWGPTVSGWLVGLPLTSGPVALFFALDHGSVFAAHAAQGAFTGLVSVAGFCLVYGWLSFRLHWLWCLVIGWGVFFALTFGLEYISVPLLVAFTGVIVFLTIALFLLPNSRSQDTATKAPRWETAVRMLVATAFVLLLTGFAALLGPQLSGLLSPFPIFASILGVFTHRFQSASSARRLLRGVVIGSFTFATFFLVIASLIERWGIAAAFILAVLAAMVMHGSSLFLMRREEKRV